MSQVILFDLDGTLTESGEGIINCVQYALEKLGKKEEHPENLQCFIGPPLKEQFMKYAGLGEEEGEKAVTRVSCTACRLICIPSIRCGVW